MSRFKNVQLQARKELIEKYGKDCLLELANGGFPINTDKEEIDRIREKIDSLTFDDGKTVDDLIMELIKLNKKEDMEKLILKVIELVRKIEKEVNGLDDEQISYKYTHGHCTTLTTLISYFCREVQMSYPICKFIGSGTYSHAVVVLRNPSGFGDVSDEYEHRVYDINGRKTYDEMSDFIKEHLMTEEERKRYECSELSRCPCNHNFDNVITGLITMKLYKLLEKIDAHSV